MAENLYEKRFYFNFSGWREMTLNRRQRRDDLLVTALARGEQLATAAQIAGVSVRTVNRQLLLADFRRDVQRVRSQLVDAAAGKISSGLEAAAECLRKLLVSESDAVKLSASRALFEIGIRLKEVVELEGRLQAVEERLNG